MNRNKLISDYYTLHRAELLAYASSRLGDKDEAEDLVQNTYLRILTTDKMLTAHTLPALVYTICRNLINDYYRRRNCHIIFAQQLNPNPATGEREAESVLSVREMTEFLERGLARLAEPCRDIYRLHIYESMKVSDIAHHLHYDYKSTEYRLGIARKEVRKYLKRIS
jgi:RNA polymerase sigma-70 factor (ECF subfamily)